MIMVSNSRDRVRQAIGAGDFAVAEQAMRELASARGSDPGACHAIGVFHLWRALDAERRHDGEAARRHWEQFIPNFVYALEHDTYLDRFREARQSAYGQEIDRKVLLAARDRAYSQVDELLQNVIDEHAKAERSEDWRRIQHVRDLWRLERDSVHWVRKLGGIPNSQRGGRLVIAGPAYARQCGFYEDAQRHIAAIPVVDDFRMSLLRLLLTDEHEDEADIKRKAGYCFSELAMPFIFYRFKQLDRAITRLDQIIKAGEDVISEGGGEWIGETAQRAHDARRLAMEIRIEVGSNHLFQHGSEHIGEALAYWSEAIQDVDKLDAQTKNPLRRQGVVIKDRMRSLVRQRVTELCKSDDWETALALAEGLAKAIPRKETVQDLIELLITLALRANNELSDFNRAIGYLERAKFLDPHNSSVIEPLLVVTANHAAHLLEAKDLRTAAQRAMDVISLARQILTKNPRDTKTRHVKRNMLNLLTHIFMTLKDDESVEKEFMAVLLEFLRNSVTYEQRFDEMSDAEKQQLDDQHRQVDAFRLIMLAAELAGQGEHELAFRNAHQALTIQPDDKGIIRLYEGVAGDAVASLCESGHLDRASDIAEKVRTTLPDSSGGKRLRTKVMLRRLGPEKILAENPAVITDAITMVESWLGQSDAHAELQKRGRQFRMLIDPAVRSARKIANAFLLIENRHFGPALELLADFEGDGDDLMRVLLLRTKCLQGLGDLDAAVETADDMVQKFPRYLICRVVRGRVLCDAGQFEQAAKDLTLYLEHAPEERHVLNDLATNAMRAGRFEDAAADFRSARREGHKSLAYILTALVCHLHLGQREEMKKVIREAPEGNDPWYRLLFEWFLGRVPDQKLLAAPQDRDQQAEVYYYVGEKARAEGRLDDARRWFAKRWELGNDRDEFEYLHLRAMKRSGMID